MSEGKGTLDEKMFPENNLRVASQNECEIRVIIGNPPYSAGQGSQNDSNQNMKYPQLDERIRQTYSINSSATNKNCIYDSYIRSIRWASDRIKDKGIVCFVINGSFIDGSAMDGLRKCLEEEFTSIYFLNLRGNQRTSGEISKREGGKIFGSGSRASIATLLLIKNPKKKGKCEIFYHNIGDYLSREEKLKMLTDFGSFKSIKWENIIPNEEHDWINQRDTSFEKFIPIGDKTNKGNLTIFEQYSTGVQTARDAWAYNFSHHGLATNIKRMIDVYNSQVKIHKETTDNLIEKDPKKISWSSSLEKHLERHLEIYFKNELIVCGIYRPYCKQWIYFDNYLNHRVSQMPKIFPSKELENRAIYISGLAGTKEASAVMVNCVPDLNMQHSIGQCFPLEIYEKINSGTLFESNPANGYTKKRNIRDSILFEFRNVYDSKISKEDIFYYVFGILHSQEYKQRFANNLNKMLPRIPLAQDFWVFSKAGRGLSQWQLNYETVEPYPLQAQSSLLEPDTKEHYRVVKMNSANREVR